MADNFINLTVDHLADEHLCCIIRSKNPHPGIEAKRQWLAQRLREGHTFRKLNVKGCVFIEYAPLETAWVPILGDNYIYVYCLWVTGSYKGHGYGRALMEYCLADAAARGKSGVCMLGAKKQKAWLSDQSFAKKFGFQTVDTTDSGYELLAHSFDGTTPRFTSGAKGSRHRTPGTDNLLRYAMPLCSSKHSDHSPILSRSRRSADSPSRGHTAKGEGTALCFQQLRCMLQGAF